LDVVVFPSRRGGEGGNHRRATTLATYEILR
jgi:hypothetical protein